jgi:hypothetical protein
VSLFRLRGRRPLLAALVAVAVLIVPNVADAGRRDDERRELIDRQMALVAELDALTASDEELAGALATLEVWVQLQQGEVAAAQDELARLMVVAAEARRVEAEKQAEVAALEDRMAEMAVAAYVAPPQADQMQTLLSADAPADAASLNVYLDVQNERDTDIVRQLRDARAALGDQRQEAEDAELRAGVARDGAVRHLEELLVARQQNQLFLDEVRARMGAAQYASDLIGFELHQMNQEMLEEARARLGSNRLVSVRGIKVHESIAPQLEALLAAAEADGVVLGGGGFRTPEEQIELRRAHCGDDPVSIWEKPPGECSPPTARPGTSLHEIGLAVDFTYRGQTISSHASPAFQWMAANAHRFGFYNLPSEPWHWSVDGT